MRRGKRVLGGNIQAEEWRRGQPLDALEGVTEEVITLRDAGGRPERLHSDTRKGDTHAHFHTDASFTPAHVCVCVCFTDVYACLRMCLRFYVCVYV